ncbi:MAG: hypothetical protein HUJ25_06965 [Crocinitomicaceae bacterium]|nr:hypothetical protein [Crocinitomicaceae bacterium]
MKKTILMFAAAGLMLATPSCKKGENDPALSLSSRKARLSKNWKLSSAEYTTVDVYDWGGDTYTSTTTYSYDGTNMTTVTSLAGPGGTVTNPADVRTYSEQHTFEKDGAYSGSVTDDGDTDSFEGFWAFVGKSKVQELKKKEAVLITFTKTIYSGNTNTYDGESLFPDGYMMLDRLAGDELVVALDYSATYSNGDTYSITGTKTYTE